MLEVKPDAGPARSGGEASMSIAEAARRTGVSVHTLRYYERAGLVVTPVNRNHSGRRRYKDEDLKWISICTKLRATGMPIKAIRRYAQLVSAGPGNEQERLALLEAHRADVTAKLAEVARRFGVDKGKTVGPSGVRHQRSKRSAVRRSAASRARTLCRRIRSFGN